MNKFPFHRFFFCYYILYRFVRRLFLAFILEFFPSYFFLFHSGDFPVLYVRHENREMASITQIMDGTQIFLSFILLFCTFIFFRFVFVFLANYFGLTHKKLSVETFLSHLKFAKVNKQRTKKIKQIK